MAKQIQGLKASAYQQNTTAVILAGGLGTRIRHLLGDLPKPMAPVAGRPFLEWVVRYFARQGIGRFVLSTGYRAEPIERHFDTQPVPGVEVVCVREVQQMGTAGGFLNAVAISGIESPVWLVANGDSLALGGAGDLLSAVRSGVASGAILGLAMPDTARYGTIEKATNGNLVSIAEKRPGAGLINAGVYAFRRELLAEFPATRPLSFETEVFPSLLGEGHALKVTECKAPFLDIGTEASLGRAENFIQDHASWF